MSILSRVNINIRQPTVQLLKISRKKKSGNTNQLKQEHLRSQTRNELFKVKTLEIYKNNLSILYCLSHTLHIYTQSWQHTHFVVFSVRTFHPCLIYKFFENLHHKYLIRLDFYMCIGMFQFLNQKFVKFLCFVLRVIYCTTMQLT